MYFITTALVCSHLKVIVQFSLLVMFTFKALKSWFFNAQRGLEKIRHHNFNQMHQQLKLKLDSQIRLWCATNLENASSATWLEQLLPPGTTTASSFAEIHQSAAGSLSTHPTVSALLTLTVPRWHPKTVPLASAVKMAAFYMEIFVSWKVFVKGL